MSLRAATMTLLVVLTTAGTASAAASPDALDRARAIAGEVQSKHGLPVSGVTTTAGVATLELFDPATGTVRSVPAADGIHLTLCGKAPRRCALPARKARAEALELARRTLLETGAGLVVVALPQTATHHLQLVFERDVLDQPEAPVERVTGERLYLMAGLLTSGGQDSLLLVRRG
jgi:hypothetical protein